MDISWLISILAVFLSHSLCLSVTVIVPSNRQMLIASVVMDKEKAVNYIKEMNKKKSLQNPWVIGTGTAILGVIGIRVLDSIIGTNIIGKTINLVGAIFTTIGNFFTLRFEVSLWVLILFPILAIGLIVLIVWLIISIENKNNPNENTNSNWLNYTEDVWDDVLYRWNYIKNFSEKYDIIEISHYCPKCRCAIVDNRCPICKNWFGKGFKSNTEIKALISHKIETEIINKSNK